MNSPDNEPAENTNAQPWWRRGWVKTAAVGVVAFLVGSGMGSASNSGLLDDEQQAREKDQSKHAAEVEELEDDVADAENATEKAEDTITELTKVGKVPDYVGESWDGVSGDEYDWQIGRVDKPVPVADMDPGTVLGQKPPAGTELGKGGKITLTVSTAAPRKWTAIKTMKCQGGTTKTDPFTVPEGRVRMNYTFGGSSNSVMTLYQTPAEYVDLLVNDIGAVKGSTRMYVPGEYYLELGGDSCTVTLEAYR